MSSPRSATPVRKLLDDRLPESRVHALWLGIDAARGRRGVPVRRAWALALGSAIAAAVLAFWVMRPQAPGPLGLADGHEVPAVIDVGAPATFAFSDGSRIEVRAGAHLDVLEATARAFGLALRRGEAVFDVQPGGPRTWRIECGDVTVEVVGTHFTVTRAPGSLRVAVERGAVLVRGDAVPDRVVRLSAGESIVISLRPAPSIAAALPEPIGLPPDPHATARTEMANAPVPDPIATAPSAEVGRQKVGAAAEPPVAAVARGEPVAAAIGGGPEPAASSTAAFVLPESSPSAPTADALLEEADRVRRAGRFKDAARLLERALEVHPSEDRAALAEFSLGRLYLDSLGDPSAASRHFARALSRHLPATLDEDARARLVEALARSGDSRAAADAAARYRALYPGGRRLRDVDQWASVAP